LVAFQPACGSGGDGNHDYFVQATVDIDGGETFEFFESCEIDKKEISGEVQWVLIGSDGDRPFGIMIYWRQLFVTGPGSFPANSGFQDLLAMLVRAHPTESGRVLISSVEGGTVNFDLVGYGSGDPIEGTFDDILMSRDEPDNTIRISVTNGVFRCKVK